MTLPEFIQAFEEDLQLAPGTLQPETALKGLARFDSMGRLSFMTMVDVRLGVMIEAGTIDRCRTVADLHSAVMTAAGR